MKRNCKTCQVKHKEPYCCGQNKWGKKWVCENLWKYIDEYVKNNTIHPNCPHLSE